MAEPAYLRALRGAYDDCIVASDEAMDADRFDLVDGPINDAVRALEDAIAAARRAAR